MKKKVVEVCDFCGAEITDELLGVSPENDNVLICVKNALKKHKECYKMQREIK